MFETTALLIIFIAAAIFTGIIGFTKGSGEDSGEDYSPGAAFASGCCVCFALLFIGILCAQKSADCDNDCKLPEGYKAEVVYENNDSVPHMVRYIQHSCKYGNKLEIDNIMPGQAKLYKRVCIVSNRPIQVD